MWQDDLEAARAKNRRDPTARYAQLASCDPDGRPRCRTVVIRAFDATTGQLQFTTDARSAKVSQLEAQPWCELCWYFPKTREQFRLLSRATVLRGDVNRSLWEAMSHAGKRTFLWPAPGDPRADDDAYDVELPAAPPPSFVGVALEVEEVDHLVLRGDPHRRRRYLRCAGWQAEAINP